MPPTNLGREQKTLYARITERPRARRPKHFDLTREDGTLLGLFNALLLATRLGSALQELVAAVQYQTTLRARTRQIAILIVAAPWDCALERSAHENVGPSSWAQPRRVVRDPGRSCASVRKWARAGVRTLARDMVDGDVDDEAWATWAQVVGSATVLELTTLVGAGR